jgi:hypothetical protein
MTGALVQLVSQGPQDKYLTGNPQLSYFRQVYKRHTNFAIENVREVLKGEPVTSTGGMSSITLQKSGDLVTGMYLMVDGASPTTNCLTNMIDTVELYIGDQKIDEFSGASLCTLQNSALIPKSFTGSIPNGNQPWLPLPFFCCTDISAPLPVVSLQYNDVRVNIVWNSNFEDAKITFYSTYIYLDTQERSHFATDTQELLITQHQEITWKEGLKVIDLPFVHPVKVLFISNGSPDDATTYNTPGPTLGFTGRMTLELNGQQLFEPQTSLYFVTIQPYYHGSPTGYIDWQNLQTFVYSFALDYGQTKPCGTLNFSQMDSVRFNVTDGTLQSTGASSIDTLRCIAINYNVLKCEAGMGGLVFGN